MPREDILPKLRNIFRDQFNLDREEPNKIHEESVLKTVLDDCGADSLDLIELAIGIEEEFNIEIPDEICDSFSTIGDVVNFVEKERGK